MKNYGANKATEFTRKQINVIYRLAKEDKLQVEQWIINDFYNLADYYGYDDNMSVANCESRILDILAQVFDNSLEAAQKLIDDYTEHEINLLSMKRIKNLNRNYV